MSHVSYTKDRDGIALLTWDAPGRPVNVINEVSMGAFRTAVRELAGDEAVRGVIVTSAKTDFIVGADLEMFLRLGDDADAISALVAEFHAVLRTLETCGKPWVAALNGSALGGGYELALACHRRIAADNPKARFGLPEVGLGLLPGGGGTQRLPRLIGIRNALPFLMEGRRVGARAAIEGGLIDEMVPAAELVEAARAWLLDNPEARQTWDQKGFKVPGGPVQHPKVAEVFTGGVAMLKKKTWGNYLAPQLVLQSVYEGLQVPIDVGLRIETRYAAELLRSRETKAMIRTLFFSLQEANKLTRRPASIPRAEFRKVGVLGAGMMGAGIAHAAASSGVEVVLLDRTEELAIAGRGLTERLAAQGVERGKLGEAQARELVARVRPTTEFADLEGCDLVVEAVFEDRGIKADVTRKTDAVTGPDCVFGSNTSTLPITGLAEASARPENFIGLHFFSPVEKMTLLEIIVGRRTSPECLARSLDFARKLGKTPIVVNDSRGFFTSRVFATYVMEGLALLQDGVRPALIENAGRLAGMAVGPLAVADEISLTLMHHIQKQHRADLGPDYRPHPAEDVVVRFVEQLNRPGRKAGGGFYDYPRGASKRLWPQLAAEFPLADPQPAPEQVEQRLLYVQCVEAARCLEESVVQTPQEADLGSIFGWGFPAFTGGVVSNMDRIGLSAFIEACDRLADRHGERFRPPRSLRERAAGGEAFYA